MTNSLKTDTGISSRLGIGLLLRIRQSVDVKLNKLPNPRNALHVVVSGRMTVRIDGQSLEIAAGQAVAIANSQPIDVTYQTSPAGSFESFFVAFDSNLIKAFLTRHTFPASRIRPFQRLPDLDEGLLSSLGCIAEALDKPTVFSREIAVHRMEELLLWIGQAGSMFAVERQPGLLECIADLVATEPANDWSSRTVCELLGLSDATLRRKLAREGTSLRTILADVRMVTATVLLLSSNMPIAAIATYVGYECPSRFALRYKARFGFSPSRLREPGRGAVLGAGGHHPAPDHHTGMFLEQGGAVDRP